MARKLVKELERGRELAELRRRPDGGRRLSSDEIALLQASESLRQTGGLRPRLGPMLPLEDAVGGLNTCPRSITLAVDGFSKPIELSDFDLLVMYVDVGEFLSDRERSALGGFIRRISEGKELSFRAAGFLASIVSKCLNGGERNSAHEAAWQEFRETANALIRLIKKQRNREDMERVFGRDAILEVATQVTAIMLVYGADNSVADRAMSEALEAIIASERRRLLGEAGSFRNLFRAILRYSEVGPSFVSCGPAQSLREMLSRLPEKLSEQCRNLGGPTAGAISGAAANCVSAQSPI